MAIKAAKNLLKEKKKAERIIRSSGIRGRRKDVMTEKSNDRWVIGVVGKGAAQAC